MCFYEEKNPADVTIEEVLPYVKEFLPGIEKENIHFFYHGTYNVFDIDQEYILRVADREFRNSKGLEMLRREANILSFLHNLVDVQIPHIHSINEKDIMPFSIYRKISGRSLVFIINNFNKKQKLEIGKEIGKFLSVLHSEDMKNKYIKNFPEWQLKFRNEEEFMIYFKNKWISWYEEAQKVVYQHLTNTQNDWLTGVFEEYLNNDSNFVFSPKVSHNDFDTSNILVDPKTAKMTGVIDFEECDIWDPAVDLLFFDEGKDFLNAILSTYEYSEQNSLLTRMKFFYCRTFIPYLVWGKQHNRPGMIEEGLKRIRKNMKMFPK